jgi:hypothetical protein
VATTATVFDSWQAFLSSCSFDGRRVRVPADRALGQKNNISLSQKEILLPFAIDFLQSRCTKNFRKAKMRATDGVCLTACGSIVVV